MVAHGVPVAVSLGFEQVLHPYALYPSLAVGIVGFSVSAWLNWLALRPANPNADQWRTKMSGESLAAAYLTLDEIEKARVE